VKLRPSQFTGAASKSAYVRDLVERVLDAAGIDASEMRFKIGPRLRMPFCVGMQIELPSNLALHPFLTSLVHEAKHADLNTGTEILTWTREEIEDVVNRFEASVRSRVYAVLTPNEQEQWDQYEAELIALRRRLDVYGSK